MKPLPLPLLLPLFLLFACQEAPSLSKPPNIVVILADDLGYGDPQVYNPQSKIPTPHIDQLAQAGMRFTDAHSPSSVCTPTRYGLLTGRYAWRTPLKKSVLWSWDKPLIEADRLTLPKLLQQNNYTTACIGKWHLGWRWPAKEGEGFVNDTLPIGNFGFKGRNDLWKQIDFEKPLAGGPLEAGFDLYFGDDVPNFPPYIFFRQNRLLGTPDLLKPDTVFGNPGPMEAGWKLEEVMPEITKEAVSFIQKRAGEPEPFFLYFSLTAPHTPIAPTTEYLGTSEAGRYGDFVHEVDASVGQIVQALKEQGEWENTLLFFTSDNGSPQRDGTKMSGKIGSVKTYGHDPSRPWKGMKGDIWEGGHRVPFIASWPGKIAPNSVSEELICHTDIMATIMNLMVFPFSEEVAEDSYDLSSVLWGENGGKAERPDIIHHALDGTFAIRKGDWKLILGQHSGGFSKNLEVEGIPVETEGQLYNLAEDPSEQHNLFAEQPDKVVELSELLRHYQNEGSSRFQPSAK